MAEGAGLVAVHRERLVEKQDLAERRQLPRTARQQRGDRRDRLLLDGIYLPFDLGDLVRKRG
jgi:hypothetical protein